MFTNRKDSNYITIIVACCPLLLPSLIIVVVHADVNECLNTTLNNCQQVCHNTVGSYTCDCMTGYTLNSNGLTCSGIVWRSIVHTMFSFFTCSFVVVIVIVVVQAQSLQEY